LKPSVESLEALLATQGESALLRFSLGNACVDSAPTQAIEHLRRVVASGARAEASAAYSQGIAVAERRGDIQAAKEMRVFLKRLAPE
jgi:hypothetical protein